MEYNFFFGEADGLVDSKAVDWTGDAGSSPHVANEVFSNDIPLLNIANNITWATV